MTASGIFQPTEHESLLADILRTQAIEAIEKADIAEVAPKLGVMPTGVESLIERRHWSLDLAFRVVELLGLPFDDIVVQAIKQ